MESELKLAWLPCFCGFD